MRFETALLFIVVLSCIQVQVTQQNEYYCTENDDSFRMLDSSSPHSASQPNTNCALQRCDVNWNSSNPCRAESIACFDYVTQNNTHYCAPGVLCSVLEPCNGFTCASNTAVCVVNTCCSPQAVCLPVSLKNFCSP
ncbi:unnamed protein product, partial [Rotaria sp. Silwood2]